MMCEPPRSRALARRQVHDALDPRLGCYNPWSGYRHFASVPKETALELPLLDQMTIAHMERPPPIPSTTLCEVSLLYGRRAYDEWPPPWWRTRTLVLPYVVDATALARASASGAFDQTRRVKRPTTPSLVTACASAARHTCASRSRSSTPPLRTRASTVPACARRRRTTRSSRRACGLGSTRRIALSRQTSMRTMSLASALHGSLALPPLSKSEVVSGMAEAKFCLNRATRPPRGASSTRLPSAASRSSSPIRG